MSFDAPLRAGTREQECIENEMRSRITAIELSMVREKKCDVSDSGPLGGLRVRDEVGGDE